MFVRGEGSMVSLQDASRRLQVPVDALWKWITDGRLAAEVRPGRGMGMEYYLDPGELKRARELRDKEFRMGDTVVDGGYAEGTAPDNVISFGFSELSAQNDRTGGGRMGPQTPARGEAIIALENLRSEALSAIERQLGREAAITELAAAVEALMNSMLEAMDRAQDLNQGRLATELEALRMRLSRQIQDRERDDLRLRDELAATKRDMASALETVKPRIELAVAGRDDSKSVVESIELAADK